MSFKQLYPLEKRKEESKKIKSKYPNRIPVICEKYKYSRSAPNIDKNKYLVPNNTSLGQFISVIRQRMNLSHQIALYVFVSNFIPSNSQFISNLYSDHKDEDGYLYIVYDIENTFGNI